MRRARARALPLAVALACACSDLPAIEPGVCGNGVVEPGEACDLHTDPALGPETACGGTGTGASACRYVCDPGGGAPRCPAGWSCSALAVCAHATGRFEPAPGSPLAATGQGFDVGDFDGDGSIDLAAYGPEGILLRTGSGGGEFGAATTLPVPPSGEPRLLDVDGDGLDDLVVPQLLGISVLRGTPDGELVPVVFAPFELPSFRARSVVAFSSDTSAPLDEFLVIGTTGAGDVCARHVGSGGVQPDCLAGLDLGAGSLAGRPPVADLDAPGRPGTEVALAFAGASSLGVYEARGRNGDERLSLRATIQLPGRIQDGAMFVQHPAGTPPEAIDLLVSLEGGEVAFVPGERDPVTGIAGFGDAVVIPRLTEELGGLPLAAADFNGDGASDFAVPGGVLVSCCAGNLDPLCARAVPAGTECPLVPAALRSTPLPWVQAVGQDLNGDGRADLVAATDTALEILLGDGTGRFNRSRRAAGGSVFTLREGDFDGDFVGDFVVGVRTAGSSTLLAFFGEAGGFPSEPVSVGRFPYVSVVEAALLDLGVRSDVTSDLLVVTSDDPAGAPESSWTFAVMQGTDRRFFSAPYSLQTATQVEAPLAVQVGRFDRDEHPDAVAITAEHAWLISGEREVIFGSDRELGLPDGVSLESTRCLQWAVGDLDRDGADQVIVLAVPSACGAPPGDLPRYVELRAAADLSSYELSVSTFEPDLGQPLQARVADLDGDGRPDVLAAFATPAGTADERSGVLVFWNDGAAAGDTLRPSVVPVPAGARVAAAAPVQADADADAELAVLTDQGVFVLDATSPRVFALPDAPVHALPGLRGGAADLEVADADGDGIDDLFASDGARLHVLLGVGESR